MEFVLADIFDEVANAVPSREAIIFRNRRLTFQDVKQRTNALANGLLDQGLGKVIERGFLEPAASGQDHLAIYMHNGNEYIETLMASLKARVAAFNVNYKYVQEELKYLFNDAKPRAIIYHARFAPNVAKILSATNSISTFIQVADESGNELLPGALDYEELIADSSADRPRADCSPDDLLLMYTGGTTGMPKGVLWRNADLYMAVLRGRKEGGGLYTSMREIISDVVATEECVMPLPPMMHGAATFSSLTCMLAGYKLVIQSETSHFDAKDILALAEREHATLIQIIGDAFARPLLSELEAGNYDLTALKAVASGGAALSPRYKKQFSSLLPHVSIADVIGSSETGNQGASQYDESAQTRQTAQGEFWPSPVTGILSEDLTSILQPQAKENLVGWLAQHTFVPLGYLGDAEKTGKTFPKVGGLRWSVPGDRAQYKPNGILLMLGRDSATINSGGEKIFAEEVELALKNQAKVSDAVVCGRPSNKWGQEVVAIVRLEEGVQATEEEILEGCAPYIARYKLPKAVMFRDDLNRGPNGKADYRWAKSVVDEYR